MFVGLFLAIAYAAWWNSADQRALRALASVPRRRLADAVDGETVRIVGRAGLLSPLTAPLSGRPCAAWRVIVQERRSRGKSSRWVTVVDDQETANFLVVDGQAKAFVDTGGAQVVLDKDRQGTSGMFREPTQELVEFLSVRGVSTQGVLVNKHMRFSEGVLEEGEPVAVLGEGNWERDPDEEGRAGSGYREAVAPGRLVMTSPAGGSLILSDTEKGRG